MIERIRSYLGHDCGCIAIAVAYLFRRLGEASTWTGIVAAIASAKEFPAPLNWLGIAAGVVAMLVPNRT